MKKLRIVCINATHSQEDQAPFCRTDKEWVQEIELCLRRNLILYVFPCGSENYLRQHFVNQTLNAEGRIIPGDYETKTPELGKVKYSIWNEQSDYWKSL